MREAGVFHLAAQKEVRMPIQITKIQTMNQKTVGTPTTFFRLTDAMALEVFISLSSDLLTKPRVIYQVVFEIIDATTNSVVFKKSFLALFPFPKVFLLCGEHMGGPDNTHPSDFGISLDEPIAGQGIYGFRAMVKALQITQREGELRDRLVSLEDFDVSAIYWFRIEAPGTLVDDLTNTGLWPGEPGVSVKDDDYPGDPPFRFGEVTESDPIKYPCRTDWTDRVGILR
jgi:hypothetical protein